MGGGQVEERSFPNANHAAFFTVVALAAGTTVSAMAAAQVATTVATVAYMILAITLGGLNMAAISAWCKKDAVTAGDYFNNFLGDAGAGIAGMYSFVAQIALQSVVQAGVMGGADRIYRKAAGQV